MKNYILRLISLLLLAVLTLLCAVPISAAEFVTGTNSVSSAYAESEFYEKLTQIKLTGDGRTDLLAVALSQLGYTEGDTDGAYSGYGNGTGNYTEYNYNMGSFGSGYGGKDYPWCASFVSFCLLQAGTHDQNRISDWCRKNEGNPEYIWREVSCNRWAKQLRACGCFEDSARFGGDYTPIPGDLIYFTEDGKLESHIGIVLYSDGERVYTVEGNTSSSSSLETNGDGVYVKSYSLSSAYLRGYGVLPYKVNNSICHIDYSGVRASAGTYISTVAKYVYPTENAATYSHVLPKYSIFTVTEVAENGRLKAVCTIDGETVEGYIKNNSDRVIQLSSSEKREGYATLKETWGYTRSSVDRYIVGDEEFTAAPASAGVMISDCVGICGSARFSRNISSFGYYFDNDYKHVTWDEDAISDGESLDVIYRIEADTSHLSAGNHEAHFVLCLADGTVAKIEDLSFVAREENKTVPQIPKLLSFTDTSVTLMATEGYEYKLGEGKWQSSNTFEGLDSASDEPYLFYQRKAETELKLPSRTSGALSIDFATLCDSTKLTSLKLSDTTLLPDFDPDVTEYTARVPYTVSSLTPEAAASEGVEVKIDAPALTEGETTDIKITVSSPFGSSRVYIIRVFREAKPIETTREEQTSSPATDTAETESPTSDSDTQKIHTTEDIYSHLPAEELSCESSLASAPIAFAIVSLLACALIKKREE